MTTGNKPDVNKFIASLSGSLNKMMEKSFGNFSAMPFTQVEDQEELFLASDFLDLNRIMTGDLFGFMPPGNIVVLAGKEASGKSLVGYNVLKNCQAAGITPVLIETEYAINSRTFRNAGIISKMGGMVVRLGYVEQAIVAFDEIVRKFVAAGIPIAICLDSLGNLGHEKTVKDIAKGDLKQDMGMFQKSLKVFLKHACHLCAAYQIPFIIVTHIFFDPSPYGGGAKIYGGQHLKFMANATTMFSSARKKENAGFELSAFSLKNRLCPPLQTATIDIDIRTSRANKYAGMVELGTNLGIFEKAGAYTYLPQLDRKMYAKEIYNRGNEIFTPDLLAEINEKLKATSYDTITFDGGSTGDMMTMLEAQAKGKTPAEILASASEEDLVDAQEQPSEFDENMTERLSAILQFSGKSEGEENDVTDVS